MPRQSESKQVSLKVFDNEPTARMAEQRLNQEGVPCLVRCLRGGPGLWGTAFNLPHDLLVFEGDELQARSILEIPPQEISEREHEQDGSPSSSVMSQWIGTLTIFGLVAFIALTVVIVNRAIR
jgi:hypothetical protein|tara:strand:- start:177 stop:545 length:369 start_codon:yes stop_codon:yes gene_type:complete